MKKVIKLVVLCSLSIFFLIGCGNDNNEIILGFDESFPPMGFRNDNGEYIGFDIDVAKEVAKKLGMKLKLQPINWETKEAEIDSNNVNCLWNGFTKTGREDKYEFTKAYMNNRQVLIVKEDSKIDKLTDLKGKKLVLQKESTAVNALDKNDIIKSQLKEVREVPDNLTAMLEVETGNSDVALLDEVVARYVIKNSKKKLKILGEALSNEEYVVAFRKGNLKFRDMIDKALDDLKREGIIKKIEEKYFGK